MTNDGNNESYRDEGKPPHNNTTSHNHKKDESASTHHIAFVTKTLRRLIQFEYSFANQLLHHCHLFIPRYEETEEDFGTHITLLQTFESFLEEYQHNFDIYFQIKNEDEEKEFRKAVIEPLREKFFSFWRRFYNGNNSESFVYFLQFENPWIILSDTAKETIKGELDYFDFIYMTNLQDFSTIMAPLDKSEDSPLFSLHTVLIDEDYRHWYADAQFFHGKLLTDLTRINNIINRNLLPKRTDYVSIENNIEKVKGYIQKITDTQKTIFESIDEE